MWSSQGQTGRSLTVEYRGCAEYELTRLTVAGDPRFRLNVKLPTRSSYENTADKAASYCGCIEYELKRFAVAGTQRFDLKIKLLTAVLAAGAHRIAIPLTIQNMIGRTLRAFRTTAFSADTTLKQLPHVRHHSVGVVQ
ncbi:hypothetical protein PYCC9005_004956 [Savitreella phatthalungensis]